MVFSFGKGYNNPAMKKIIFILSILSLLNPGLFPARAQSLAASVTGRILLDVESHGEAWYVDPLTSERYYLKDGEAAYSALEDFGLGISNSDLAKISVGIESRFELTDSDSDNLPDAVEISLGTDLENSDSDSDGYSDGEEILNNFNPLGLETLSLDNDLSKRLSGRILLQVESHGEAWYVYPVDSHRYYLGDGEAAYQIMRYLSLGITSSDLDQITIASNSLRPPFDDVSDYESYTIDTNEGSFTIKLVMLRRDSFKMVTDTAEPADCESNCDAKPLADYISENSAFAGIHGTYFCPPDYFQCSAQINSFDPPVYNSTLGVMINDNDLIYNSRPMITQTSDEQMHYFHRTQDFGDNLSDYELNSGLKVSAAISNWPSLVEGGESVVASEPLESSFYNKGTRGGMGWDDDYFYLVIASSATVPNLAAIFETLGVNYAMNLDGGGTAGMYYDGAYKVGPGRELANAVLFVEK